MERDEAIEILERMQSRIENDSFWLALDLAIETLEGKEIKKNVVNVIPQECMKILSDAVMEAIRSIDWITLGEKMSERPTGRWLEGYHDSFETLDCSECGYVRNERYSKLNYCPNCGAKMKEV